MTVPPRGRCKKGQDVDTYLPNGLYDWFGSPVCFFHRPLLNPFLVMKEAGPMLIKRISLKK